MSSLVAGFIKGATGRALDSIDERRKMENEEKKARLLAELQRETSQANALFEENLPSSKLKRQADEQRMRLDASRDERDARKLDFDMRNADRDDARAERLANAQIGSYNRANRGGGGRGGIDQIKDDTLTDRLAIANKVTRNLSDMGYTQDEVRRARAQLVDGARKGWSLDQFSTFESSYMQNPELLEAARAREDAARLEAIKKRMSGG